MAIVATSGPGYKDLVGHNSRGHPIYLYQEPRSGMLRYIVVLPNGRAVYSDPAGNIGYPADESANRMTGAMLGGLGAFALAGPVAALAGAVAGAILGDAIFKNHSNE